MTTAAIGYGSEFAIGDGADPEVFTKVAEVTAITPPGMTRDAEEATHLESPDKYKEYVAALFDTGDVSITFNFVPSESDTIFTAFHAESANFQITFPNGIRMRFTGFFTSYDPPELLSNGNMSASATIKRSTGKPALLAAAT